MKWHKIGKIFEVSGNFGWMNSHAQIPTVLVLDDRLRVYFATRPEPKISLTGFVDLDINDPTKLIYIHDKPILQLGDAGHFDEHGIMPNYVFTKGGEIKLFYVGWSRREMVPYSNWMGIAVSEDNGYNFRKQFNGPILDRTKDEVFSATGLICVRKEGQWFGFYATGTKWLEIDGRYEHVYELRSCFSSNTIDWARPNKKIIENKLKNESNTRPTIAYLNGVWHMWFCYRGIYDFRDGEDSYRIGHAISHDLLSWTRSDSDAGICLSEHGWDSKMIAYPYVVQVEDKNYLFYCGNGFGRSGFGCAELIGD